MTYEDAISYIRANVSPGSRPGLLRVKELLERIGSPQDDLKIIHVTGTNGKGSVCVMLESILRAAGYRTGLFTSPYMQRMNDCIRLDGRPIEDSCLAKVTDRLRPSVEQMEDRPTEFEFLTGAALSLFREERCDIAILETGMGARKDATNVTKQCLLSVITNVELDHMGFLGSTIEEIAFEKSGIIKPGCPVVFGGKRAEALNMVRRQAMEKQAPLTTVPYSELEVVQAGPEGSTIHFDGYGELRLALPGLYQPSNAAIVLTALQILKGRGIRFTPEDVKAGMEAASWPGRFEVLLKKPLVIYDGAHNIDGMTAAVETIKQYFDGRKIHVLMGVMSDKEYERMIVLLQPVTEALYAVTPANPRALPAGELAACFQKFGVEHAFAFDSVPEAVDRALEDSLREEMPLMILGTLYLYEEAEAAVRDWEKCRSKEKQ